MSNTQPPITTQHDPEDEYFVFAIPEGGDEDDELIFSVLPLEQGLAILNAEAGTDPANQGKVG